MPLHHPGIFVSITLTNVLFFSVIGQLPKPYVAVWQVIMLYGLENVFDITLHGFSVSHRTPEDVRHFDYVVLTCSLSPSSWAFLSLAV